MTVYVHVGVGKTGTTALQSFMHRFRDDLHLQGFHVPETCAAPPFLAHHVLAKTLGFASEHESGPDIDVLRQFSEDLAVHEDKHTLISSENFHSNADSGKVNLLKQVLGDRDVKIIIYLRRQDEWVESAYRQFARSGNGISVKGVIEHVKSNGSVDYAKLCGIWSDCFGVDNLILRVYEDQQMNGDTVMDFSTVVGIKLTAAMGSISCRENPSMSALEIEIMRFLQRVTKQDETIKEVLAVLRKDSSIQHQRYFSLSIRQREDILKFYKESNAFVAREYLNRTDGQLFYDLEQPVRSGKEQVVSFSSSSL